MAFAAILLGITLQALLFQHGGVTTIGVNAIMMGLPAILAAQIFQLRKKVNLRSREVVFGFLAGSSAIILATFILALTSLIMQLKSRQDRRSKNASARD